MTQLPHARRFPRTLVAGGLTVLSALAVVAGCSLGENETGAGIQAIDVSREPNETDAASSLAAVGLDKDATGYIDLRGVGDAAWSGTHQSSPMSARFGAALDGLDPTGRSYRGDLSFINWESVVGDRCARFSAAYSPGRSYAFVSRVENLSQAYAKGFNLVGLSNNHSRDCAVAQGSEDGVGMSLRLLKPLDSAQAWLWHGIEARSRKNEAAVRTFRIKGRDVRVAFASLYNGRADCPTAVCANDATTVFTNLRNAAADLRVLSIHSQGSQGALVDLGIRFLKDFDGDVVFGHGPHVWAPVRVVEKKDGRRGVMFESLGNFIHPGLAAQSKNLIGRVLIDPSSLAIKQVQIIPVATNGGSASFSSASATSLAANVNWRRDAAIKGAFANIKDESRPVTPADIECPAGYSIEAVGTRGGRICSDGVNAYGPFTKGMIAKCKSWGGLSACDGDRWALSLAISARGTEVCPAGSALDRQTRYCTEGTDAFGPFPQKMVDICVRERGGEACRSARWGVGMLRLVLGL
jgi:hypothetical protein